MVENSDSRHYRPFFPKPRPQAWRQLTLTFLYSLQFVCSLALICRNSKQKADLLELPILTVLALAFKQHEHHLVPTSGGGSGVGMLKA